MKKRNSILKYQPPGRLIVAGFAGMILLGTVLLLLPVSVRKGAEVTVIDALFTSTSAVCVTGLIAIDTAEHFTASHLTGYVYRQGRSGYAAFHVGRADYSAGSYPSGYHKERTADPHGL